MPKDIKTEVRLNNTKLKLIQSELRKKYVTRIGVLGSDSARTESYETNATIGATHEFGSVSEGIPERSFLRDPLREQIPEEINSIADSVFKGVTEENAELFYKKLGALAESIVQEAFNTGGFGKWPPLSERTIKKKGFDDILIHTTQLRKSITSEVIKN